MFWKKKEEKPKVEKLPGPKGIPELVGRHLVVEKKREPDWVWNLKVVMRPSAKGGQALDVRVFSESEAVAKNVKVKDYLSFDEHPDLILYEGWFDKKANQVELQEGKGLKKIEQYDVPILTEAEIRQKIEALGEPGSTASFYLGASPSSGGPLGRGAAVVELNPRYPGPKEKKYIIYTDNVDGLQLQGKRQKLFDSDKAKEVAKWVKERHHKPLRF